MKLSFWFLHTLVVCGASFAQGQEPQQNCASVSTPREILACAESRAPQINESSLALERARALEDQAGQWRNPELSLNSVRGNAGGEARGETDVALSFPVELGGKISARRSTARAQIDKAEAEFSQTRASLRSEIMIKLQRLRQIEHEREVTQEAIQTFTRLIEQFSRRPGLSPEQRVSSVVYQMAKSEYEIKLGHSQNEMAEIVAFLVGATGVTSPPRARALPLADEWPRVSANTSLATAPAVRLAEAELRAAQGELLLQQSESWPTLSLGPSLKIQQEGGTSQSLVGFNLGFPFPFFNVNGAGRKAAAQGVKLVEAARINIERRETIRRESLVREYEQAIATLKKTMLHREIEKRHQEMETLFVRGLVPSSLVIEAHRTYLDLEKSRNEVELRALEILYTIAGIDGVNLEFGL